MTDIDRLENVLCHVDISTECGWEEDDVRLIIDFRDGPLAGCDYTIDIKKEDFIRE